MMINVFRSDLTLQRLDNIVSTEYFVCNETTMLYT